MNCTKPVLLRRGDPIRGARADLIVFDDAVACPKCGAAGDSSHVLMTDAKGNTSCFDCMAEEAFENLQRSGADE